MNTSIDFHKVIQGPEYDFLRNDPRLGDNIILLGLGGSHAYGTSTPTSDVDCRGIALNPADEILLSHDFEQVNERTTDTVVYSFNKMVKLLSECNPNTIEILGLKPEHYLIMSDVGKEMVANADMFLSKKAVDSFGGYACQQLRRLQLLASREVTQAMREEFILATINHASYTFKEKYGFYPEDGIHLFLDTTEREGFDQEIFMDINLKHYPLRDWTEMWAEMQQIVRSYNKLGSRNSKAIEHGKISKHQMHLARLYIMAFDILYDGKIITYREKEHDFLMDVRNGKYITESNQPTKEFMEMVNTWEEKLKHAAAHSPLPDKPDYERINRFRAEVNYSVIADAQFPLMEEAL